MKTLKNKTEKDIGRLARHGPLSWPLQKKILPLSDMWSCLVEAAEIQLLQNWLSWKVPAKLNICCKDMR